jgi:hypothetical protein
VGSRFAAASLESSEAKAGTSTQLRWANTLAEKVLTAPTHGEAVEFHQASEWTGSTAALRLVAEPEAGWGMPEKGARREFRPVGGEESGGFAFAPTAALRSNKLLCTSSK